jgi:hypothetical protein
MAVMRPFAPQEYAVWSADLGFCYARSTVGLLARRRVGASESGELSSATGTPSPQREGRSKDKNHDSISRSHSRTPTTGRAAGRRPMGHRGCRCLHRTYRLGYRDDQHRKPGARVGSLARSSKHQPHHRGTHRQCGDPALTAAIGLARCLQREALFNLPVADPFTGPFEASFQVRVSLEARSRHCRIAPNEADCRGDCSEGHE